MLNIAVGMQFMAHGMIFHNQHSSKKEWTHSYRVMEFYFTCKRSIGIFGQALMTLIFAS